MIRTVSVRSGTTAEWADADPADQAAAPVLALGELGVDTDAGVVKVGDGVTAFPALSTALGGTPEEEPATFTSITPDTATDAGPTSFTVVGTGLPANVNGGCKIGFVGKPLVWGTVNPARTQVTFNFTFNNPADTPGTYDLTMWTADDFSSDPIAEVLTAPDVVTYTPA